MQDVCLNPVLNFLIQGHIVLKVRASVKLWIFRMEMYSCRVIQMVSVPYMSVNPGMNWLEIEQESARKSLKPGMEVSLHVKVTL